MSETKSIPEFHPYVTSNGGVVILNGPFPIEQAQRIANLCEMAPAFLAACKAAADWIEGAQEVDGWLNHDGDIQGKGARDALRAAIALAERQKL